RLPSPRPSLPSSLLRAEQTLHRIGRRMDAMSHLSAAAAITALSVYTIRRRKQLAIWSRRVIAIRLLVGLLTESKSHLYVDRHWEINPHFFSTIRRTPGRST